MEFTLQKTVRAERERVFEYYSNVENLPKLHPEYVKQVRIIEKGSSLIIFELDTQVMGRVFTSTNKTILNPFSSIVSETIDGYGKGGVIKWSFGESSDGTVIIVNSLLKLGLLGEFLKGRAQKMAQDMLDLDAKRLE